MCTVTFIARRRGYALGMNRDEQRTRATAKPAARHRLEDRDALFPSEPGGGTWIGVNDSGVTLALINWYSVAARVQARAVSRGEVVRWTLRFNSPGLVSSGLEELCLAKLNPFRLLGVFPAVQAVVEWRWNLRGLERLVHTWQTNTWISSGFDEPGAQRTRLQKFTEMLRQRSAKTTGWLRRLHRSHAPQRGPYSTCMHREDAATVSYTEVAVSNRSATLRYKPGPPCGTAPARTLHLQLKQ